MSETADENKSVYIPKWAYIIMGSIAAVCLTAFVTFLYWLASTAISHGQQLKTQSTELKHINSSLTSIDGKLSILSALPVANENNIKLLIQQLENYSEKQLYNLEKISKLESRIRELELK